LLINGIPVAASVSSRHHFNAQATRVAERRAVSADQELATPSMEKGAVPVFRHVTDPNREYAREEVEGIARDRWDVAIESATGTTLVECGAIRERVSQELARAVFDAVKRNVEKQNDARG
jgi:hypothetical protein